MLLQPEEPFGTYNVFFMDLPVNSFTFHSSSLTAKGANVVVAHHGFLCEWIFNYKGAFQTVLDSFCCVKG